MSESLTPHDEAVVAEQLGRPPRAIHAVGHRCPCGNPDVVTTEPRLPGGTPFPTTFYLTCPRAASLIGTLEGSGLMAEMTARLADDPELAAAYAAAHRAYLAARAELGSVPEIEGISAGGMPDRVKCLHVLAGQSLAQGRGVNPLGDEVLDRLGDWWAAGPCVQVAEPSTGSTGPVRAAGIDCGTNTIKLLVADVDPGTGRLVELVRETRMVRLGQGVDASRSLHPDALGRVLAAVDEYAGLVAEHGVERLRFCATSAVRDATNRDELVEGVRERLGVTLEVLPGAEEARLSYAGATRTLGQVDTPVLVVDIGGGSTELVVGGGHGDVHAGHSLDIGSVRLTERFLASDPPTEQERGALVAAVDAALDTLPGHGVDLSSARTVVAVSGTGLTVAAAVLDLPALDRARVDRARVSVADVHAAVERLVAMTVAERRDLPFMPAGRADVIGAGALILDRVLARVPADHLTTSVSDILDGITWSAVEDAR